MLIIVFIYCLYKKIKNYTSIKKKQQLIGNKHKTYGQPTLLVFHYKKISINISRDKSLKY